MVDERRKNTRILEWFGPPERNTLRPLWGCIALEFESLRVSKTSSAWLRGLQRASVLTGTRSLL
jgi:hypothetical protein